MSTDILTCYNYIYKKINKPNKDYLYAKWAKEYNHKIWRSGNLTNVLIFFEWTKQEICGGRIFQ